MPRNRTFDFASLLTEGGGALNTELELLWEDLTKLRQFEIPRLIAGDDPLPAKDAAGLASSRGDTRPGVGRQLVNNARTSISMGAVCGLSSGLFAPATGVSTGVIRPVFISSKTARSGQNIIPVYIGNADVQVETGITIAAGNAVWLSASEAGSVTNVAPANPHSRFLLGQFSSSKLTKSRLAQAFITPFLSSGGAGP